jgi:glyoxylase-like metal-dependent hydrolase (beta-lactamase superfamily II)
MPVFFRTVGALGGPSFFIERGGRGLHAIALSLTVAVIERPAGLCVIDTGWSRAQCAFPHDDPGALHAAFLGMRVKPEDALASQLLSCGYDPGDVRDVIATHGHRDHVDGVVDFPKATVHLTDTELRVPRPGVSKALTRAGKLAVHALKGPAALGFLRSHDVFGDGSVLLLDAAGHTPGSAAVAVALDEGWMIHAGDAAMFARDYRDDASLPPSPYMRVMGWDMARQREGFARLRAAERDHGARVVTSHDRAGFDALPHTKEEGWTLRGEKKKRRKG